MARERDEPVRLTRIYTRGGDAGETSLGDGSRTSKLDPRIAASGAVDELNSALGLVVAGGCPGALAAVLERVQNELFDLGADITVPPAVEGRLRIGQHQVEALERDCDAFNEALAELTSFVLPGGTRAAAALHLARTVCRRAELAVLAAGTAHQLSPLVGVYLNRLADLLFILARSANLLEGREEPLWRPGATR